MTDSANKPALEINPDAIAKFNKEVDNSMGVIRAVADKMIAAGDIRPASMALACALCAAEMTYLIAASNEATVERQEEMLASLTGDMSGHMQHVRSVVEAQAEKAQAETVAANG